jgi:hypothetical protein
MARPKGLVPFALSASSRQTNIICLLTGATAKIIKGDMPVKFESGIVIYGDWYIITAIRSI